MSTSATLDRTQGKWRNNVFYLKQESLRNVKKNSSRTIIIPISSRIMERFMEHKMKFSKVFLFVSIAILLAACSNYKMSIITPLDRSDKTITIQAGAAGLKGKIKDTLRQEGWKIRTDAGPTKTTGAVGGDVDLQTSTTFRTRYRMAIDSRRIDTCIPSGPLYVFEMAVIDNDTGDEILTMDGRECEDRIVEDFLGWLRGANVRQTSR